MEERNWKLAFELSPLPHEVAGAVFVLESDVAVELILRRGKLAGGNFLSVIPLAGKQYNSRGFRSDTI